MNKILTYSNKLIYAIRIKFILNTPYNQTYNTWRFWAHIKLFLINSHHLGSCYNCMVHDGYVILIKQLSSSPFMDECLLSVSELICGSGMSTFLMRIMHILCIHTYSILCTCMYKYLFDRYLKPWSFTHDTRPHENN